MANTIIADIKILPLGTGDAGVSHLIAGCVKLLENAPDISYRITPMSTIVEGPLDRVMELVKEMHEVPFASGVRRVVTSVSIDDRRDKPISMESKVKAVEEKIDG
jgi:uncharacterized protein (TIGR00106 family)